jgi:hypothetical protein
MTGIAAAHALERLGWRCEAPVLPPPRVNEAADGAAEPPNRCGRRDWQLPPVGSDLTSIRRFKRVAAAPNTARVDIERIGI